MYDTVLASDEFVEMKQINFTRFWRLEIVTIKLQPSTSIEIGVVNTKLSLEIAEPNLRQCLRIASSEL